MNDKKYVKKVRVPSEDNDTIKALLEWLDPNETAKFTFKGNHYTVEFNNGVLSRDNAEEEFKSLIVDEVY